jgi:hypothetical protein
MKATPKDKKYYFAMRDEICEHLNNKFKHIMTSRQELHEGLKYYADLEDVSMEDIDHDQIQQLKEWTKQYALEHCGLDLDAGNGIQFNWNLKE